MFELVHHNYWISINASINSQNKNVVIQVSFRRGVDMNIRSCVNIEISIPLLRRSFAFILIWYRSVILICDIDIEHNIGVTI